MPRYRYVALTREGGTHHGDDDAASPEDLGRRLRRRQLVLVEAKPVPRKRVPSSIANQLVGELATLLDSGLMLDRALQVLVEEGSESGLAQLAATLRDGLKRGQSLSDTLDSIGRFDPLLIPVVRAGEASGELASTLASLEKHYEARRRLHAELITNLVYPVILLVVSLISIIALGVYVVPVFRELYADSPTALPLGTRIIFTASDAMIAHGVSFTVTVLTAWATAVALIRWLPTLRASWHGLLLALPLVGSLLALAEGGRLMTLLGVLLQRGVPLVRALELARDGVTNLKQRVGLTQAIRDLRLGRSLPLAMTAVPALPERVMQLLKVGDESGRLAEACAKAGERLQHQLTTRIRTLVAMLEPAIILSMGALIGSIVVSMLLAVFNLTDLAN